jgi:Fasciclin domain
MKLFVTTLIFTLTVLVSCTPSTLIQQASTKPSDSEETDNVPDSGRVDDFEPPTLQSLITQSVEKNYQSLFAKAIITSNIFGKLTIETYPYTILWPKDEGLKAYLAGKMLSEEDFLNHPNLKKFVEAHIVAKGIDMQLLSNNCLSEGEAFDTVNLVGNPVIFYRQNPDSLTFKVNDTDAEIYINSPYGPTSDVTGDSPVNVLCEYYREKLGYSYIYFIDKPLVELE